MEKNTSVVKLELDLKNQISQEGSLNEKICSNADLELLYRQLKYNEQINHQHHGIAKIQTDKGKIGSKTVGMKSIDIEGKIDAIIKYYKYTKSPVRKIRLCLSETFITD